MRNTTSIKEYQCTDRSGGFGFVVLSNGTALVCSCLRFALVTVLPAQFVKVPAGVGREVELRFLQQQRQTTARGEIQISAGFLKHPVVNLVAFLCEI